MFGGAAGSMFGSGNDMGPLSQMLGMALSPQEQNLYWHHLTNLYGGRAEQPNGDISTLLQAVVGGPGGQFYSIPTVWGGQALTVPEATQNAANAGWGNWPAYSDPTSADLRYESIHRLMDQDTARYLGNRR
jgi:hypothetical protein